MDCYTTQYHIDSAISWIQRQVDSKDCVYSAMLFPLRLLQRWGKDAK